MAMDFRVLALIGRMASVGKVTNNWHITQLGKQLGSGSNIRLASVGFMKSTFANLGRNGHDLVVTIFNHRLRFLENFANNMSMQKFVDQS